MADPQHLEWLKEGVASWNARRERNDFVPDLNDADLPGEKLLGVNLKNANLQYANLVGTDLQRADLSNANLQESNLLSAKLRGANLRGARAEKADFWGANLRGAKLNGADLRNTDLRHAQLNKADLTKANLTLADLQAAAFDGTKLTHALLEEADARSEIKHLTPAPSDEDKIAEITDLSQSRGLQQNQLNAILGDSLTRIPEHLTRPTDWIVLDENLEVAKNKKTLKTDPPFVFVSYSSEDREKIRSLIADLERDGIKVWWDQTIKAGDIWSETIQEKLETANAILTLWSEASTISQNVIEEARLGGRRRTLIHARLDRANIPYGFGEYQYLDLFPGRAQEHENWPGIKEALRAKLNPPSKRKLQAKLAAHSREGFVERKGRADPRFKPVTQKPSEKGNADCSDRLDNLLKLLAKMLSAAKATKNDANIGSGDFEAAAQDLHDALYQDNPNWFNVESNFKIFRETQDFDLVQMWRSDRVKALYDEFEVAFHKFEPCIRPPYDDTPPAPLAQIEDGDEALAEEAGTNLHEAMDTEDAAETITPTGRDMLGDTGEELEDAARATNEDASSDPNRYRKLFQRIAEAASRVAQFLTDMEKIKGGLKNVAAAERVISAVRAVWDKLAGFFT